MLFRNIKNKKLYKVIGKARSVEEPEKVQVIYKQLYKSRLLLKPQSYSNIILPYGTIWIRERQDFRAKFIKIK